MKQKIYQNYLDINSTCNSSITTKISSIKCINLDKIAIYVDTFNIFKNSNTKKLLIYDINLNMLNEIDNYSEVENIINCALQQNKLMKSSYETFFNDLKFVALIEEKNLIPDNDEKLLFENYKLQSETKSIEEKILFYHQLNQKNELIYFLGRYLTILIKYNLFYKIVDFFNFYFNLNDRKFFDVFEEKKQIIVEELIRENITNSENFPKDLKLYIQK